MARFVLVHGAFSGGWIWEKVATRLRDAGHVVEAPDLPGSGEDTTPLTGVTLESCAERVCKTLRGSSQPSILAGHSMGGVVATQAAALLPDRVAALVYVAAFAPQNDQSLLDLTQLPEGAGDEVQGNIAITGDPPVAAMPSEASRGALYGSCTDEVASWAISRHRPQPVAVIATPVSIAPGALSGLPRYYVCCVRDRAIPPALQRRMGRENACIETIDLDTDHTPHLSTPDQLANILQSFAARVVGGAAAV